MILQNKNIRLGEKSGRELLEAGTRRLRQSKLVFYTCYHTPVNNFAISYYFSACFKTYSFISERKTKNMQICSNCVGP